MSPIVIDFTINLPTILSGFLAIIGLVAWFVRLEGKTDQNKGDIKTLAETLSALEELVTLNQKQFQEHRLEAAQNYVTQNTLSEIKRDLIGEMKSMEARMEQMISRAVARPS